MTGILRRTFARIARNERGSSLVEFAIVAPVFGMLVVGISDLARGFSEKFAIQQAVNRTIERAHHGSSTDNYNYLIAEATAAATAAGATSPTVVLKQWLECNGSRVEKPWTGECAEGEQIARYLTLTINASFKPSFGTVGYVNAKADGTVPITASTSLRVQ